MQPEVFAAGESPDVKRVVVGLETVERTKHRARIGGSRRRSSFSVLRVNRSTRPPLSRRWIRGLA
jgi:hypothetical protein